MSEILLDIREVAGICNTTVAGIASRVRRARKGQDTFPMPKYKVRNRLFWETETINRFLENPEKSR